jgi:hypothetical protein
MARLYPFKVVFLAGERRSLVGYATTLENARSRAAKELRDFDRANPSSAGTSYCVGTQVLARTSGGWFDVDALGYAE